MAKREFIDINKIDISGTIGGKNDFADCIRDSVQAVIDNAKPVAEQEIVKPYLEKLRAEIMDMGAYEQEVNGKTEFLEGINYCLGVIDKYKAESEEEQPKQTRNEKMIDAIDFAIKATDSQDDYRMGMRNGMRYVKSLIDGKEPQYELRRTDDEIKLGINLGDEVVGDYGSKGVVVGIDTYKGEVWLSLLMRNHKVPQLVKASGYKTKTNRHFPQIIEVLEQIKGEADGK